MGNILRRHGRRRANDGDHGEDPGDAAAPGPLVSRVSSILGPHNLTHNLLVPAVRQRYLGAGRSQQSIRMMIMDINVLLVTMLFATDVYKIKCIIPSCLVFVNIIANIEFL